MATLETQYKNYQSENPDSILSFDEWKKEHGQKVRRSIQEMFEKVSSPEYKQEQINKNEKYLENLNMGLQLGYYVGEKIVDNYLPTLSTDMLCSRRVIQVNEEDSIENKRLDEEWFNSCTHKSGNSGDEEKWDKYHQHNKMLEKKYLPPVLECAFGLIKINDMDQFKEGLISSLWNCDMCSYDIKKENIEIENNMEYGFTYIRFKLRSE